MISLFRKSYLLSWLIAIAKNKRTFSDDSCISEKRMLKKKMMKHYAFLCEFSFIKSISSYNGQMGKLSAFYNKMTKRYIRSKIRSSIAVNRTNRTIIQIELFNKSNLKINCL